MSDFLGPCLDGLGRAIGSMIQGGTPKPKPTTPTDPVGPPPTPPPLLSATGPATPVPPSSLSSTSKSPTSAALPASPAPGHTITPTPPSAAAPKPSPTTPTLKPREGAADNPFVLVMTDATCQQKPLEFIEAELNKLRKLEPGKNLLEELAQPDSYKSTTELEVHQLADNTEVLRGKITRTFKYNGEWYTYVQTLNTGIAVPKDEHSDRRSINNAKELAYLKLVGYEEFTRRAINHPQDEKIQALAKKASVSFDIRLEDTEKSGWKYLGSEKWFSRNKGHIKELSTPDMPPIDAVEILQRNLQTTEDDREKLRDKIKCQVLDDRLLYMEHIKNNSKQYDENTPPKPAELEALFKGPDGKTILITNPNDIITSLQYEASHDLHEADLLFRNLKSSMKKNSEKLKKLRNKLEKHGQDPDTMLISKEISDIEKQMREDYEKLQKAKDKNITNKNRISGLMKGIMVDTRANLTMEKIQRELNSLREVMELPKRFSKIEDIFRQANIPQIRPPKPKPPEASANAEGLAKEAAEATAAANAAPEDVNLKIIAAQKAAKYADLLEEISVIQRDSAATASQESVDHDKDVGLADTAVKEAARYVTSRREVTVSRAAAAVSAGEALIKAKAQFNAATDEATAAEDELRKANEAVVKAEAYSTELMKAGKDDKIGEANANLKLLQTEAATKDEAFTKANTNKDEKKAAFKLATEISETAKEKSAEAKTGLAIATSIHENVTARTTYFKAQVALDGAVEKLKNTQDPAAIDAATKNVEKALTAARKAHTAHIDTLVKNDVADTSDVEKAHKLAMVSVIANVNAISKEAVDAARAAKDACTKTTATPAIRKAAMDKAIIANKQAACAASIVAHLGTAGFIDGVPKGDKINSLAAVIPYLSADIHDIDSVSAGDLAAKSAKIVKDLREVGDEIDVDMMVPTKALVLTVITNALEVSSNLMWLRAQADGLAFEQAHKKAIAPADPTLDADAAAAMAKTLRDAAEAAKVKYDNSEAIEAALKATNKRIEDVKLAFTNGKVQDVIKTKSPQLAQAEDAAYEAASKIAGESEKDLALTSKTAIEESAKFAKAAGEVAVAIIEVIPSPPGSVIRKVSTLVDSISSLAKDISENPDNTDRKVALLQDQLSQLKDLIKTHPAEFNTAIKDIDNLHNRIKGAIDIANDALHLIASVDRAKALKALTYTEGHPYNPTGVTEAEAATEKAISSERAARTASVIKSAFDDPYHMVAIIESGLSMISADVSTIGTFDIANKKCFKAINTAKEKSDEVTISCQAQPQSEELINHSVVDKVDKAAVQANLAIDNAQKLIDTVHTNKVKEKDPISGIETERFITPAEKEAIIDSARKSAREAHVFAENAYNALFDITDPGNAKDRALVIAAFDAATAADLAVSEAVYLTRLVTTLIPDVLTPQPSPASPASPASPVSAETIHAKLEVADIRAMAINAARQADAVLAEKPVQPRTNRQASANSQAECAAKHAKQAVYYVGILTSHDDIAGDLDMTNTAMRYAEAAKKEAAQALITDPDNPIAKKALTAARAAFEVAKTVDVLTQQKSLQPAPSISADVKKITKEADDIATSANTAITNLDELDDTTTTTSRATVIGALEATVKDAEDISRKLIQEVVEKIRYDTDPDCVAAMIALDKVNAAAQSARAALKAVKSAKPTPKDTVSATAAKAVAPPPSKPVEKDSMGPPHEAMTDTPPKPATASSARLSVNLEPARPSVTLERALVNYQEKVAIAQKAAMDMDGYVKKLDNKQPLDTLIRRAQNASKAASNGIDAINTNKKSDATINTEYTMKIKGYAKEAQNLVKPLKDDASHPEAQEISKHISKTSKAFEDVVAAAATLKKLRAKEFRSDADMTAAPLTDLDTFKVSIEDYPRTTPKTQTEITADTTKTQAVSISETLKKVEVVNNGLEAYNDLEKKLSNKDKATHKDTINWLNDITINVNLATIALSAAAESSDPIFVARMVKTAEDHFDKANKLLESFRKESSVKGTPDRPANIKAMIRATERAVIAAGSAFNSAQSITTIQQSPPSRRSSESRSSTSSVSRVSRSSISSVSQHLVPPPTVTSTSGSTPGASPKPPESPRAQLTTASTAATTKEPAPPPPPTFSGSKPVPGPTPVQSKDPILPSSIKTPPPGSTAHPAFAFVSPDFTQSSATPSKVISPPNTTHDASKPVVPPEVQIPAPPKKPEVHPPLAQPKDPIPSSTINTSAHDTPAISPDTTGKPVTTPFSFNFTFNPLPSGTGSSATPLKPTSTEASKTVPANQLKKPLAAPTTTTPPPPPPFGNFAAQPTGTKKPEDTTAEKTAAKSSPQDPLVRASVAAKTTVRQPTELELRVGGGVVNDGRNICYGISLIQGLRQSESFRTALDSSRPPEPMVIPTRNLQQIIALLPNGINPNLKSLKASGDNSSISVADYAKLIFLIEKNAPHLSPENRALIEQTPEQIRMNSIAQIHNMFAIIDSGGQVDDTEIDLFRSLTRQLGWQRNEPENAQQDSGAFLTFIFENILRIPPFQYQEIASQQVRGNLSATPETHVSRFKQCPVPTTTTAFENVESLLNPKTVEEFVPIENLYRQIVEPNQGEVDSAKLKAIGGELVKLRAKLQALTAIDKAAYNYNQDPVYQLLNGYKNLSNISMDDWNTIQQAARYIYYERSLIPLFDRFVRDLPIISESLSNDITKLLRSCPELTKSPYYIQLTTLMAGLKDPSVSAFFSASTINTFITELRRDILTDEGRGLREGANKSISEVYTSLNAKKTSLTPDQEKLLTLLGSNITSRTEPLKFNISAIKSHLDKNGLKAPEMDKINEAMRNHDRVLKSEQVTTTVALLQNLQGILKIEAPNEGNIVTIQEMCKQLLDNHKSNLQQELINVLANLLNGIPKKIADTKTAFNGTMNEFVTLREKNRAPNIPVQHTFTISGNPPAILPITLNRFVGSAGREQYLETPVAPSDTIRVKVSTDPPGFVTYNLKSVVVRDGPSRERAHYYTYVPQHDGSWVEFNDTRVSKVNPGRDENGCMTNAATKGYMYLYELQKPSSSKPATTSTTTTTKATTSPFPTSSAKDPPSATNATQATIPPTTPQPSSSDKPDSTQTASKPQTPPGTSDKAISNAQTNATKPVAQAPGTTHTPPAAPLTSDLTHAKTPSSPQPHPPTPSQQPAAPKRAPTVATKQSIMTKATDLLMRAETVHPKSSKDSKASISDSKKSAEQTLQAIKDIHIATTSPSQKNIDAAQASVTEALRLANQATTNAFKLSTNDTNRQKAIDIANEALHTAQNAWTLFAQIKTPTSSPTTSAPTSLSATPPPTLKSTGAVTQTHLAPSSSATASTLGATATTVSSKEKTSTTDATSSSTATTAITPAPILSPSEQLATDITALKGELREFRSPPFGKFFSVIPVANILITSINELPNDVSKLRAEELAEKQKLVSNYQEAIKALREFKNSIPQDFVEFLKRQNYDFRYGMSKLPNGEFQRMLMSDYAAEKFREKGNVLEAQFNTLWPKAINPFATQTSRGTTEVTFNASKEKVLSFLDSSENKHWKQLFQVQENLAATEQASQAGIDKSLLATAINVFAVEFKKCMTLDDNISKFFEETMKHAQEEVTKNSDKKDDIRRRLGATFEGFTNTLPQQSKQLAFTLSQNLGQIKNYFS